MCTVPLGFLMNGEMRIVTLLVVVEINIIIQKTIFKSESTKMRLNVHSSKNKTVGLFNMHYLARMIKCKAANLQAIAARKSPKYNQSNYNRISVAFINCPTLLTSPALL